MSIIYGWSIDYILDRYSIQQIAGLFEVGYKYDHERRGIELKEEIPPEEWEQAREELYTEEERRQQEKMLRKLKRKNATTSTR